MLPKSNIEIAWNKINKLMQTELAAESRMHSVLNKFLLTGLRIPIEFVKFHCTILQIIFFICFSPFYSFHSSTLHLDSPISPALQNLQDQYKLIRNELKCIGEESQSGRQSISTWTLNRLPILIYSNIAIDSIFVLPAKNYFLSKWKFIKRKFPGRHFFILIF